MLMDEQLETLRGLLVFSRLSGEFHTHTNPNTRADRDVQ